MGEVVSFYGKNGSLLSEIECNVSRSWVLNGYGKAKIMIPKNKISRYVMEVGNYVYIRHDKLPDWAGIIEPTRIWYSNSLEITAYTGAYILNHRDGPCNYIATGTCGEIVSYALAYANREYHTNIYEGEIYQDGAGHQETLNFSELYDDIRRVCSRSKLDWEVVPSVRDGKLMFLLNVKERIGKDTLFTLEDGFNLAEDEDRILTEDGLVVNSVIGYGDGSSWESRPFVEIRSIASIEKYGFRQHAHNFSGNTIVATVKKNTEKFVSENCYMKAKTEVVALDVGETFYNVRLGNKMKVILHGYGFLEDNSNVFGFQSDIKIYGIGKESNKSGVDIAIESENTDYEYVTDDTEE